MTTTSYFFLAAMALSAVTFCFLIWKNLLLRHKLRIRQQRLDNREFELISNIVEQERTRISTELHDELGSLLSIIYLDLELVTHESSSLSPEAESHLIKVRQNLKRIIETIRNNIWNLSSQMFDKMDLAFALRELCHKFDRYKGTNVSFVQSGIMFLLSEKNKLHLFRISQELLTNAIKHSSAWNISVHLHWENDRQLSITVEDDGVAGVSPVSGPGMGLNNIIQRANYVGANVSQEKLHKGHRTIISLTQDTVLIRI